MKNFLVSLTVSFLVAGVSTASELVFRSGEHENFTRIVVNISPSNGYEVKKYSQKIQLTFPGSTHTFNTSEVFRKIGKTRIKDVISLSDSVEIILNCDCRVEDSIYREDYLVIDVMNPSENEVTASLSSAPTTNRFDFDPLTFVELSDRFALQGEDERESIELLEDFQPKDGEDYDSTEGSEDLAKTVASLATKEILSQKSSFKDKPNNVMEPIGLSDILPPLTGSRNLRATNSLDVSSEKPEPEANKEDDKECRNPKLFEIWTWKSSDTLPFMLGSSILDFSDDVSPSDQSGLEYVMSLILLSMGREASRALEIVEADDISRDFLLGLSEFSDGTTATSTKALTTFLERCIQKYPFVALVFSNLSNISEGDLILAISQADMIRAPLGQQLLMSANSYAKLHQFHEISELISRKLENRIDYFSFPQPKGVGVSAEPQGAQALDLTSQTSGGTHRLSDPTSVSLENSQIREEDVIAMDFLSFVYRYRSDSQENESLSAVGLSSLGDFRSAFQNIKSSELRGVPYSRRTIEEVVENLIRKSDDITFLQYLPEIETQYKDYLSPDQLESISRRAEQLGFDLLENQFLSQDMTESPPNVIKNSALP